MSILDHEDIIFEDALRRSVVNNAKAVIDSRSCVFKMAGALERELKIATKDYFVGEIVWCIEVSNLTTIYHYVLYEDKDGNPEWLKID